MFSHRQQFSTGFFLLLLLAFHDVIVDGFKSGAPPNTCWTLYPKHHGIATQTTPCPFLISPSSATYVPGQEITVRIAEPGGKTFSGFELGVYRDHADKGYTAEVVGQFTEVPADKVKTFTCFPGYKNMATHTNLNQVDEIVLKWTAPTKNLGNLVLRGTIVANFTTFWTRVEKRFPVDNSVILPVSEPVYQVTPIASIVKSVQFSECGNTIGCFLYPRHCTGDDCVSAVSYKYRPDTDDFLFEMYSDAAENYISVGFSDDRFMSHEETVTCASNDGEMSVQHGWNPHYHNERLLTRFLTKTEVKHADGRLQCRFILERLTEVYEIDQGASSLQYSNTTYDHKQPWYLQLAWGKTMPESVVISYHKEMPTTTTSMVHLTETTIHRGSSFHVLVQAHAAIMMVAWILLAGLVTIVSRHFRNLLPRTRWFGTKVWFQVHRGLAISITVFTAIGLTLIFAHYGAEIRELSIPHSYVGLAMTAALAVEVIAGLLRPGPASKYRVFYNWGHRCLGQIAHILAAVTMFLAYDIEYVTPTLRKFGFITLGIWICVQILWCIGLEVLKRRREAAAGTGSSDAAEHKEYDATCDLILLGLYSVTMAALCVACLLAFLLF